MKIGRYNMTVEFRPVRNLALVTIMDSESYVLDSAYIDKQEFMTFIQCVLEVGNSVLAVELAKEPTP